MLGWKSVHLGPTLALVLLVVVVFLVVFLLVVIRPSRAR